MAFYGLFLSFLFGIAIDSSLLSQLENEFGKLLFRDPDSRQAFKKNKGLPNASFDFYILFLF